MTTASRSFHDEQSSVSLKNAPPFPRDRDEYSTENKNEVFSRLARKKLCSFAQGRCPFARVRRWFAKRMGISIARGARPWIGKDVYLDDVFPELIELGNGAVLGLRCMLICHDDAKRLVAPIQIGEGAFVGAAAIVLPGVRIGPAAKIGAGSVVTRSVPAGEVWAGVPARPISSGEPVGTRSKTPSQ